MTKKGKPKGWFSNPYEFWKWCKDGRRVICKLCKKETLIKIKDKCFEENKPKHQSNCPNKKLDISCSD